MGVKYEQCEYLEVHKKEYAHIDPDVVVAQIFADLYPKIWDLINDKKHFRKSKRHGVLYSKGHKQHVFYITNSYFATNSCLNKLFKVFASSRLGKYTYKTKDLYVPVACDYLCFRVTPYIVIKTTAIVNNGSRFSCSWKYGIFGIDHVMGYTRNLNPYDQFLVQIPYEMASHEVEGRGRYLVRKRDFFTKKWKTCFFIDYPGLGFPITEIHYENFRIETYNFFKFFDIVLLYMYKVSVNQWSVNRLWDAVAHTIMEMGRDPGETCYPDSTRFMEYATERSLV